LLNTVLLTACLGLAWPIHERDARLSDETRHATRDEEESILSDRWSRPDERVAFVETLPKEAAACLPDPP
jgi:hypothetical protein